MTQRAMHLRDELDNPRYRVRAVSGPLRLIEEIVDAHPAANATPAYSPSIERLFGARVAGQRILFVQPLDRGRRVTVAGTFNAWNPLSHAMRRNEELGIHELALDVDPGVHEYRLVVDGVWVDDPFATERNANEFGGYNAIVRVYRSDTAR